MAERVFQDLQMFSGQAAPKQTSMIASKMLIFLVLFPAAPVCKNASRRLPERRLGRLPIPPGAAREHQHGLSAPLAGCQFVIVGVRTVVEVAGFNAQAACGFKGRSFDHSQPLTLRPAR
jgi:hypothetical protein